MFKEFKHDFGTVVRGEDVEYRFEIENVYEEDMHIQSVNSSCGCTKVSVTKNVLKTWEKAEIVAKFDTMAFSGARSARLTVQFAQPYFAQVYLDVKGVIRTDTSISPGSINFGSFSDPATTTRTVTLTRFGNPNWKIVDVMSSYPHVTVALNETERNANRVSYQLTATVKDTAPKDNIQSELMVVASDNPKDRKNQIRFPVSMMGSFTSPVQISPQVLNIANVRSGEEIKKKVIVKADRPFILTDVTCENNAFRVVADQAEKNVHFVEIIYVGEAPGTNCETKLQFKTNLPSAELVELTAIVSVEK